jgi:hypothetical protein
MPRGKTILLLAGLSAWAASFALPQGSEELHADRVQCANLIYAGNKTSQCFSDRFLKRLAQETTIHAETHFRKVRLDSPDLCSYPFAIMTGEGGFTLTEKERVQLRYYLTHGGFLLASAGCSDAPWVRAFRAEFARLFPGERMTRLSLSHPLFHVVYNIESVATRKRHSGPNGAGLEAFSLRGRIVLLFSSDGLNDTEYAENCCCCGGDEIERAEFVNVNALAYALLH